MKIFDLFTMCVRNLTRRKFRTFLTVMGVLIGTTSIVIMISLGVGISTSFDDMISRQGDLTMVDVMPQGENTPITEDAVTKMQALPGVVIASPILKWNPQSSVNIFSGRKDRYSLYADFTGLRPEALEMLGYTAREGELKLGGDDKVINLILGSQVPYDFRDTKKRWPNDRIEFWQETEEDVLPEPFIPILTSEYLIRADAYKEGAKPVELDARVTGVIQFRQNDWESRGSVFISIDDLKALREKYEKENSIKHDKDYVDSYNSVKIKVDTIDNVSAVEAAIREMDLYPQSLNEIRESLQANVQQTQLILGILGGVSLFVAAISITNTMIMSVYERTREIGVMKVLGCLVGNIRTIFLLEAGMIGLFGGMLGIGISYLLSYLFNTFGGELGAGFLSNMPMEEGSKLSIIPPWLVLLGLSVATVIGLVAGFYPANRAVRISALEAIKQE